MSEVIIFPVFAGMVPVHAGTKYHGVHFPRIRGDGPNSGIKVISTTVFSPYSRGWSLVFDPNEVGPIIFPVFAGMVPACYGHCGGLLDFPRIRGDGPIHVLPKSVSLPFSPYSRGWSRPPCPIIATHSIFPVFAGMVPEQHSTGH